MSRLVWYLSGFNFGRHSRACSDQTSATLDNTASADRERGQGLEQRIDSVAFVGGRGVLRIETRIMQPCLLERGCGEAASGAWSLGSMAQRRVI